MDETARFEAERPRLLRIAGRVLGDPMEAEDIVQQSWLRLHGTDADVANLPGWLSTVVTRLCLDRLRARTPVPTESSEAAPGSGRVGSPHAATTPTDPADHVALADTVGVALQVVLDRLTPGERVAFVLHDAGQRAVATMFDGAAKAALPVLIGERPGAAWFHRGEARVLFDFTVEHGVITRIVFRAEADVLARVVRRTDGRPA